MIVNLSVIDAPGGYSVEWTTPGRYVAGSGSAADFRIPAEDDPYLSAQHALFEMDPPDLKIRSLGGVNPISVNESRIREGVLADGDIVAIGLTRVAVRITLPRCHWCRECDRSFYLQAMSDGRFGDLRDVAVYSHPACLPPGDENKGKKIGDLIIQKKLGSGGFGSVFLAQDLDTSRVWAVKQLSGRVEASGTEAQRFQREGRFLLEHVHPKIARCVGIGVDPAEGPFLVCEFVPGGDLMAFIRRNGVQSFPWARAVMTQVLAALHFLHTRPSVIVHRDVKPHNVLLGPSTDPKGPFPAAKLADFGISRALSGPGSTRLTQFGCAPGTFYYLAPEVILQGASYGPAADVYSVGVTMYYVMTGTYPYDFPKNAEDSALLYHLATNQPVPVAERLPGIPPEVALAIDTACRKDPAARYPSAKAFAEALYRAEGIR